MGDIDGPLQLLQMGFKRIRNTNFAQRRSAGGQGDARIIQPLSDFPYFLIRMIDQVITIHAPHFNIMHIQFSQAVDLLLKVIGYLIRKPRNLPWLAHVRVLLLSVCSGRIKHDTGILFLPGNSPPFVQFPEEQIFIKRYLHGIIQPG